MNKELLKVGIKPPTLLEKQIRKLSQDTLLERYLSNRYVHTHQTIYLNSHIYSYCFMNHDPSVLTLNKDVLIHCGFTPDLRKQMFWSLTAECVTWRYPNDVSFVQNNREMTHYGTM